MCECSMLCVLGLCIFFACQLFSISVSFQELHVLVLLCLWLIFLFVWSYCFAAPKLLKLGNLIQCGLREWYQFYPKISDCTDGSGQHRHLLILRSCLLSSDMLTPRLSPAVNFSLRETDVYPVWIRFWSRITVSVFHENGRKLVCWERRGNGGEAVEDKRRTERGGDGQGMGGGLKEARWRGWVTGREVVVCVLDERMEGVNPFLHHYLVSATALTLISLRAARPARSLPHPSIHPSTPFKPHHQPSLLIPFTSFSFFLCSLFFLQRFPHFLCLSLSLSLSHCASSSSLWKLTEIPNP